MSLGCGCGVREEMGLALWVFMDSDALDDARRASWGLNGVFKLHEL